MFLKPSRRVIWSPASTEASWKHISPPSSSCVALPQEASRDASFGVTNRPCLILHSRLSDDIPVCQRRNGYCKSALCYRLIASSHQQRAQLYHFSRISPLDVMHTKTFVKTECWHVHVKFVKVFCARGPVLQLDVF